MARGLALTKNIALPLAQLASGNTDEFMDHLGSTALNLATSLLPGGSIIQDGAKVLNRASKAYDVV